MQYKLSFWNRLVPGSMLKKHPKINKNKTKAFIIFSSNTKLNWLLFRNIIKCARLHFRLEPLFFETDNIGLQEVGSDMELNANDPTFNILSRPEAELINQEYIHSDIRGISYQIWWDQLKVINKENTNLLLFSNNPIELKKICDIVSENKNREIVILNIFSKQDNKVGFTKWKNDLYFKNIELWNIKYSEGMMKEWKDKDLYKTISEKFDIKKHKRIRKIRNKMFSIMNEYYRIPIIPGLEIHLNDGEIKNNDDIIKLMYE